MIDGKHAKELSEVTFAEQLINFLKIDLDPLKRVLDRLKAQTKENTSLEELMKTFNTIGWIAGNFCVDEPVYSFLLTTVFDGRYAEINHSDELYIFKDQAVNALYHVIHAQAMFFTVADQYCRIEGTHLEKVNRIFTGRETLFKMQLEQIIAHKDVNEKMFYMTRPTLPYNRGYRFENLPDYIWYIFMQVMEYEVGLSQCDYCGHFFIPQTKKKTRYCDRVRTDDGRTCKQIGPQLIYRSKLKHSELLADYDRAINRNYRRVERYELKLENEKEGKDMTYGEYYDWLKELHGAKAAFLAGMISEEEFRGVIHGVD